MLQIYNYISIIENKLLNFNNWKHIICIFHLITKLLVFMRIMYC